MTIADSYTEMTQSIEVAEELLNSDFNYSNKAELKKSTTDLKNIIMLYPTSSNATTAHNTLRDQILISTSEADFIADSLTEVD